MRRFDDLDTFDWKSLQKVLKELNFFGLRMVDIKIWTPSTVDTSSRKAVETWVRKALKDLDERDALSVSVLA